MSKNVFLFSGQGSQYVGMAKEFYEKYDCAKSVFDKAQEVLGYDLKKIVFEGPDSELNKTVYSQPAIMATSLCAFEALKANGVSFSGVAGHSLGEYAAIVVSEMVTLKDGFRLIKARAEAMQKAAEANKGAMCAVIGPSSKEVEDICSSISGYVVPVNYNSPVQTVIAGEISAVDAAVEIFSEKKARCMRLNVSSAFHSKLMQSAADEFINTAKAVSFSTPKVAFYSNLLGERLTEFSDMPTLLTNHIVSPVRFVSELEAIKRDGFDTFIELGPNKVLTGLVRKTLSDVSYANVENEKTLEKALEVIAR